MKCTVVEINNRTDEMEFIKYNSKKQAEKYIRSRYAELSKEDRKIYDFGINKGWEETEQ